MTFTVVALPKCYDRTADVVDDTNWSTTLQHMSAVAEYLVGQDITPPYTGDGTNTTSIVGIDDPLCTTQSCITNTNPKNAETQSARQFATWYMYAIAAGGFVLIVLTFVILICCICSCKKKKKCGWEPEPEKKDKGDDLKLIDNTYKGKVDAPSTVGSTLSLLPVAGATPTDPSTNPATSVPIAKSFTEVDDVLLKLMMQHLLVQIGKGIKLQIIKCFM